MYVVQYYELPNKVLLSNSIGFDLNNFDVFRYKVLILLKTKYNTYHTQDITCL